MTNMKMFTLYEIANLLEIGLDDVKDLIACGDLAAFGSERRLSGSATLTVSSALIMKRMPVLLLRLQTRRIIWLILSTATAPFI